MEHRRDQRSAVRLTVNLSGRRCSAIEGEILDLSTGGAFIRLKDKPPALDTIIKLNFQMPAPNPQRCKCRAMIVRNDKDGVGVMFARRQDQLMPQHASPWQPCRRSTPGDECKTADRPAQQQLAIH